MLKEPSQTFISPDITSEICRQRIRVPDSDEASGTSSLLLNQSSDCDSHHPSDLTFGLHSLSTQSKYFQLLSPDERTLEHPSTQPIFQGISPSIATESKISNMGNIEMKNIINTYMVTISDTPQVEAMLPVSWYTEHLLRKHESPKDPAGTEQSSGELEPSFNMDWLSDNISNEHWLKEDKDNVPDEIWLKGDNHINTGEGWLKVGEDNIVDHDWFKGGEDDIPGGLEYMRMPCESESSNKTIPGLGVVTIFSPDGSKETDSLQWIAATNDTRFDHDFVGSTGPNQASRSDLVELFGHAYSSGHEYDQEYLTTATEKFGSVDTLSGNGVQTDNNRPFAQSQFQSEESLLPWHSPIMKSVDLEKLSSTHGMKSSEVVPFISSYQKRSPPSTKRGRKSHLGASVLANASLMRNIRACWSCTLRRDKVS
jgi:hypothetical protein